MIKVNLVAVAFADIFPNFLLWGLKELSFFEVFAKTVMWQHLGVLGLLLL